MKKQTYMKPSLKFVSDMLPLMPVCASLDPGQGVTPGPQGPGDDEAKERPNGIWDESGTSTPLWN